MSAALRIVFDVLVYRLRRLEMANMLAAVAILLALGTPWPTLAGRAGFALVLNLLTYLTNDYYDVDRDLATGRADAKSRFLRDHPAASRGAIGALVASSVVISLAVDPGLLLILVLGGGVCWVYSAKLKMIPFVDIPTMIVWGVVMPAAAFPLDHALGWCLALQLGLFSACFESIQIIRDHDEDRDAGIETTATRLGPHRTLVLARAFMLLSTAYAIAVLNRWVGLALLVAPLLPLRGGFASAYWTRVRLVLGITWLGILAAIYLTGASQGWFVSLGVDARFGS